MLRAYLKLLFRTGFKVWSRHEAITVLIAAAIATALAWLSAHELEVVFGIEFGHSTFAIVVFLWFVVIVLAVAPYQIWKDNTSKITALEDRQRPKIELRNITTDTHEDTDGVLRTVYLTVHNIDMNRCELRDCIMYIDEYVDQSGSITYVRAPLRTRNQKIPGTGRFYLRAEQPKDVVVARLNETDPDAQIELGYADPTHKHPFIVRDRRLRITISGYADKGGSVTQHYDLYVDDDGTLRLTAAS